MFLKITFYLFAVLPILFEGYCLSHVKKVSDFITQMKATERKSWNETQKAYSFYSSSYLLWAFVGCMTANNWPIFIFLILAGFIPKKDPIIRWIDSFISLILILFAIINTFHLHIDIFHWIINS